MKPAIEVRGLGKSYVINHKDRASYSTIKDDFSSLLKNPFSHKDEHEEKFWALKDVNFDIQPGEIFGIIGRNGSGKSTLLKILSRIVDPTEGDIKIRGRVASLLEVGTGFNPELTGRENIYFNGSMLGMNRREITKKFDEIVAFSEVEKFLDTPVKFYSSGMYVRLAFSVAAHLDPDILILDEVLSVGDDAFQKKSLNKILSSMKDGKTILFVSHSMGSVNQLCDRAMLLSHGNVELIGDTEKVSEAYLSTGGSEEEAATFEAMRKELEAEKSKPANITLHNKDIVVEAINYSFSDFRINSKKITDQLRINSGSPLTVHFKYQNKGLERDVLVGFGVASSNKRSEMVAYTHNKLEGVKLIEHKQGEIWCTLNLPHLSPGVYSLEINVWLDDRMFIEREIIGKFVILPTQYFSTKQTLDTFPSLLMVESKWVSK